MKIISLPHQGLSIAYSTNEINNIRALIEEAMNTDGSDHKQWLLNELSKSLNIIPFGKFDVGTIP